MQGRWHLEIGWPPIASSSWLQWKSAEAKFLCGFPTVSMWLTQLSFWAMNSPAFASMILNFIQLRKMHPNRIFSHVDTLVWKWANYQADIWNCVHTSVIWAVGDIFQAIIPRSNYQMSYLIPFPVLSNNNNILDAPTLFRSFFMHEIRRSRDPESGIGNRSRIEN
jgi:hypothetical protein